MNIGLKFIPINQSARLRAKPAMYRAWCSLPGLISPKAFLIDALSSACVQKRLTVPLYWHISRISRPITSPSRSASVAMTTSFVLLKSVFIIPNCFFLSLGTWDFQDLGNRGKATTFPNWEYSSP